MTDNIEFIRERREQIGWRAKFVRGYILDLLTKMFSSEEIEREFRDPDLARLVWSENDRERTLGIVQNGDIDLDDTEEARIIVELGDTQVPIMLQHDRLYKERVYKEESQSFVKQDVRELWRIIPVVGRCVSRSRRTAEDLSDEIFMVCRPAAGLIESRYGFTKFECMSSQGAKKAGQIMEGVKDPNLWVSGVVFNVEIQQVVSKNLIEENEYYE